VKPDELVFTSGGTESNNLAIRGMVEALAAVLKDLERGGVSVTRLSPRQNGIIEAEDVMGVLRPGTVLVTLAHVNSELGTIEPLAKIGEALRKRKDPPVAVLSERCPETFFPVLHADAAQSLLYLDASPHAHRALLVSYDAQKIGGPKGVGILYRDASVPLAPVLLGGSQERGLRPGTENVPAIVGAALAFELAKEGRSERTQRVEAVRDYLIGKVLEAVPNARLMGDRKRRIAGNADFSIPGADGDYLAVLMDQRGVAVTPRSACVGSGGERSEVVYALTGDDALARSTVRFSLGPNATKGEVDRAVYALLDSLATFSKD
jgi:cysteine desulfurase